MRKKRESIIIAYLKDFKVEDIYEHHVMSICNGRKPSKTILLTKYQYLLHIIITRCKRSDTGECHLNAQFYRDHMFHDHWNDMLRNLSLMGIIYIGGYSVGEHSTSISLVNWNIGYMTSYNQKLIRWAERDRKRFEEFSKVEDTPFTRKYMDSLGCLRLIGKDDALAYIDENIKDKQSHSYHYHKNCIDGFNENEIRIFNIDNQGRIYHHLTSLPSGLRGYFNIKYEIDISNSHPLILNHFLINYYNIPLNIINRVRIQYHYDVEKLSKLLIENDLDVPFDVLDYIIKTMKGKFYDDFIEEFGDMERSEVKKRVFSQVFYSHITDSYVSRFCKAFIRKYPNVWKVINEMKKRTNDKLPLTMMKGESKLFGLILEECWNRDYKVVNLHDALIVFDIDENKDVTVSGLTDIIEHVYHRFKLFPTIKVEIGQDK